MPRLHTSICTLISGGLDSGLLLHRLLLRYRRIVPVYVRCGLRWEASELYWLRRLLYGVHSKRLAPLTVVDLPLTGVYRAHWSLHGGGVPPADSADAAVYLPGRNVLLLTVAALLCAKQDIPEIALGVLKGNPFADATPRFLSQLAGCLSQALHHRIRIVAPLLRTRKSHLIQCANGLPLALTFSCLRPLRRQHCGRCNKCGERRRAFDAAGVTDPTKYHR